MPERFTKLRIIRLSTESKRSHIADMNMSILC